MHYAEPLLNYNISAPELKMQGFPKLKQKKQFEKQKLTTERCPDSKLGDRTLLRIYSWHTVS